MMKHLSSASPDPNQINLDANKMSGHISQTNHHLAFNMDGNRMRSDSSQPSTKHQAEMAATQAGPFSQQTVAVSLSSPANTPVQPDELEQLNREIKDITALYNIGVTVGASLRLKDVIQSLYNESRRLVDTTSFALVIDDAETDTLNFVMIFDQGKRVKPFSLNRGHTPGLTKQILSNQTRFLISDLLKTKHVVEVNHLNPDRPIRSWLGAPIYNPVLKQKRSQGAMILWSYEPDAFTDRDLWLLSAIGAQAAIAIRNARLYESSQRRAQERAMINDVARTLASTLDLEKVLIQIMGQIETVLNAEAGFLLLTDTATGDLVFQVGVGDKTEAIKPFRIAKGQGIAGQVALTGKSLCHVGPDRQINFPIRNVLCVPLISHKQVIGILEVVNKRQGNFTQQDGALLSSIASFAAMAIWNARLYDNILEERDRVIEAEEVARKELARDLHDGPTQEVAGLVMDLEFCERLIEEDPSRLGQEIPKMRASAERVMHQMRTALFELRPLILETEGLEAALRTACERWQKDIETQQAKLTLEIENSHPGGHISRQESKVEVAIFAIVQEAVNNAIKHAQADNIVVHLKETTTSLYITIADDGQGFDVDQVMKNYSERSSLGMVNIRERIELIGGGLSINATPGQGAQIRIYVPKAKAERLRRRGTTGRLTLPK